jgi:hypothetical protein
VPTSPGQFLGKSVVVSIPSLFDDGEARLYTLVGIEANGLWLQSADLSPRLCQTDKNQTSPAPASIFFPFAQIAYLFDSTALAHPPPSANQAAGVERSKLSGSERKGPKNVKRLGADLDHT